MSTSGVRWRRRRGWESGVCPPPGRSWFRFCGRRWRLCPRGGRAAPPPPSPARAGARCSSLLLWWGELTLGGRLGSLTQIRHDKEGESGTWAEPRRGGCGERGRKDLHFKVKVCQCSFTSLDVLRRLRVKWVRLVFSAVQRRGLGVLVTV